MAATWPVVPASTDAAAILALNPDGIFYPADGDHKAVTYAIGDPVNSSAKNRCSASAWGISCWQLHSAAMLAELKFGHRGVNAIR